MKNKIMRVGFYISLIPYILVIIFSIRAYYAGYDVSYVGPTRIAFGWEALTCWFTYDFIKWYIFLPIIPICFVYQLFYSLRKFKKVEKVQLSSKSKNEVMKICFYISFIPYIYLIINSVHAYWSGYNTGFFVIHMVYGWEAVSNVFFLGLLWLSTLLPIIPVCFIYQLFYGLRKFKKARKIVLFIISVIVLSICFSFLILSGQYTILGNTIIDLIITSLGYFILVFLFYKIITLKKSNKNESNSDK